MATPAEQLTTLKTIQRSGVKRVTTADRTVEYRALAEIEAARTDLEGEIDTTAGAVRTSRISVHVDRGF